MNEPLQFPSWANVESKFVNRIWLAADAGTMRVYFAERLIDGTEHARTAVVMSQENAKALRDLIDQVLTQSAATASSGKLQ